MSTVLPLKVNVESRAITGKARHPASNEMISSVMPSAKNSCSGSPLKLAKGRDRALVVEGGGAHHHGWLGGGEIIALGCRLAAHAVDADGSADVLQLFPAEVLEFEIHLVGDVMVNRPGDQNAAGFGERL
jgi:hypothetical protein